MREPRWRALFGLLALVFGLAFVAPAQAGPPGMPDPRQMSGVPRLDPGLAPGSVTVRCLLGSFQEPAIGQKVTLTITGADGAQHVAEATSVEQGRATFEGLEPHFGGTAIASTQFEGATVSSGPIEISSRAGARVLLVKGAASPTPGPAAPPSVSPGGAGHGGHGEVPLPGKPFVLEGRDPGTVVVGALDLNAAKPIEGVTAKLEVLPPEGEEGEPRVLEKPVDENGRAIFEGLVAPDVPEGARIRVSAVLGEGEAPTMAEPFVLGERAVAVVLTSGGRRGPPPAGPPAHGATPGPPRPSIPGPHADPEVPPHHVQVRVVNAKGEPVEGAPVNLVARSLAAEPQHYADTTGATGTVTLRVDHDPSALYFAGVVHQGAPFRSTMFEIPEGKGVQVHVLVRDVKSSVEGLRAAVQLDLQGRENDLVQVNQILAVMHDGEEAWWRPGFRIWAPPGAKGMEIMPRATAYLEKPDEEAPFAELKKPIPPGEEVRLSIAYLLPHDGAARLQFDAPFPVARGLLTVPPSVDVTEGVEGPPDVVPHGGGDVQIYEFTPPAYVPGPCDRFAAKGLRCPPSLGSGATTVAVAVADLPTSNPLFVWAAAVLTGFVALLSLVAIVLRPRVSLATSLAARRAALERELERELAAQGPDSPRARRLAVALDTVVRRANPEPKAAPSSGSATT